MEKTNKNAGAKSTTAEKTPELSRVKSTGVEKGVDISGSLINARLSEGQTYERVIKNFQ